MVNMSVIHISMIQQCMLLVTFDTIIGQLRNALTIRGDYGYGWTNIYIYKV
jgi:hypothetical protein